MKQLDHILYGGTFDPPHTGHVEVVMAVLKKFPKTRVTIMPSPSPASALGTRKDPTGFDDRFAMCKLAFATILNSRVELRNLEGDLPPPHYSVNTLRHVKKQTPGERLGFLIGEDQLADFAKWRSPLEILELADLVVVSRAGETFLNSNSWELLGQQLQRSIDFVDGAAQVEGSSGRIIPLEADVCSASSTTLRNALNEGKPIPEGWLDPAVETWIRERNLYHGEK